MIYTTRQNGRTNCIACAKARPQLGIAPFRLGDKNNPVGLRCIPQLSNATYTPDTDKCMTLSLLFPPVKKRPVPPSVTTYSGNYTCLTRTGEGANVSTLPQNYFGESLNVPQDSGNYSTSWFLNHTSMRADLWRLCGDMKLRPRPPSAWHGSCTLTQIL